MVTYSKTFKEKFFNFYQRQQTLVSISTFSFGFLIDVITYKRVYTPAGLSLQAAYLIILGLLIAYEIKIINECTLDLEKKKWWTLHNLSVHFLFGSLLSLYTIFYFNSASAISSFLFILLLAILMLANEMRRIRKIGLPVGVILFSICTLSYFSFLYPIVLGKIGSTPFWLGILSSLFVTSLLSFRLKNFKKLKNHVLIPSIGVHLFFIIAYNFSLIPPVPVALKKIGIFHDIEKKQGQYIGKYLDEGRTFWPKDSTFLARKGDKLNVLLSIFSPDSFKDKVYLKWYHHKENKGWTLEDSIPLNFFGGREAGFRGYGIKQAYTQGPWKIIVETSDRRELGSIKIIVIDDSSTTPRTFSEEIY
jgi:hypothetical protein